MCEAGISSLLLQPLFKFFHNLKVA
jgi:hypothetical protein